MRKNGKFLAGGRFQRATAAGTLGLWVVLGAGCAGGGSGAGTGTGVQAPAGGSDAAKSQAAGGARATSDPFALPAEPRDTQAAAPDLSPVKLDAWKKAISVKGVSAAPAKCAAFGGAAKNKTEKIDLATALAEASPEKRDANLAVLEAQASSDDDKTFLRALRADMAPTECADAVADPWLRDHAPTSGMPAHVLVGASLAAKLARTAEQAPVMKSTADKEEVKKFIKGPLRSWVVEQATAIETLSAAASSLGGYGRGIVAVVAGDADLRLVTKIRNAPVPSTWDKELKAVYEAALDEALNPRKARGRDAALVGLADFASARIIADARVARVRSLLGDLYGGRRIDALGGLLLPKSPSAPTLPAELPMVTMPTPFLEQAAATKAISPTPVAIRRGLPRGLDVPPAALARARLALGFTYWRRVDFVEAAYAAKAAGNDPDARLLLALALTLAKGPKDAREMMLAPSPAALGLDRTEALDAIVSEGGPNAGIAAYDAALVRSLAVPEGAAAASSYLRDVAARYRKAATLLDDPATKELASKQAADAEAAAAAVSVAASPPS